MKIRTVVLAAMGAVSLGASAVPVAGFDAGFTSTGSWFNSDIRPGGTSSVVNLAGMGGNLETAQPLPTGAAKLTTDNTNIAMAEVSVADNYGKAGSILSTLNLHYSYYRANAVSQNSAAAPSIKLTFYNATYAATPGNDGYVTLIYEPYWQTGGADPASNVWTAVDINFANGLFWQNGGFGQANSAGGPPLHTLQDWAGLFDAGFAGADLLAVRMGMGSYNPGVTGYFDDVRISHSATSGAYSAQYDFELPAGTTVPEPGSLALAGLALAGLAFARRARCA